MNFIAAQDGDGGKLPLIHTTDKYTLSLIRDTKVLKAEDDDVYPDEKLAYLFYGRPSYRVNSHVQNTSASYFAPICLIFDRHLLNQAWRIMPFDTGAHAAGQLKHTIHKRMERDQFALDLDPTSPMKLIRTFYGDETSYLEGEPQPTLVDLKELQQTQNHHAEAYYHLVHFRSNSSTDDRVNAIEVQFNKDIEIKGNLKAVIIPSRHFAEDLVSQIETEMGATCIMYDMPANYKPNELMNTIYEKVRLYLNTERT